MENKIVSEATPPSIISYTVQDLEKAFYAARSGISTSPAHSNKLSSESSYPTFEKWLNSFTREKNKFINAKQ